MATNWQTIFQGIIAVVLLIILAGAYQVYSQIQAEAKKKEDGGKG